MLNDEKMLGFFLTGNVFDLIKIVV